MHMNHINLSVANVRETKVFMETYFDLKFLGGPNPEKIVAALDENGSLIALSNFSENDDFKYPGTFHIGFNLSSREKVDAMHDRMTTDGLKIGKLIEFHGAWTFYVNAPGGFIIEVFHQYGMDQIREATIKAKAA